MKHRNSRKGMSQEVYYILVNSWGYYPSEARTLLSRCAKKGQVWVTHYLQDIEEYIQTST